MAIFQASATSPDCAYNEGAEMPDEAFAAVLVAARKRFNRIPTGEFSADSQPILRDATNEEVVKMMLGKFLLEWTNKAKEDAIEAALASMNVAAPDWTVVPPAA